MNFLQVRQLLIQNGNAAYKSFNDKLLPGVGETLGVPVPVLRKFAKTISKDDWASYLKEQTPQYHEEYLLWGILLGEIECPIGQRIELLQDFVAHIYSWSICDTTVCGLKFMKSNQDQLWPTVKGWLQSEKEFVFRFGVVVAFTYFLSSDQFAAEFFSYIDKPHTQYYAQMAVAWGLQVSFVHKKEQALLVLKQGNLDKFTHNKAIQKCRESYQVSQEDKAMLLCLKK